jgi:hypothetical protein
MQYPGQERINNPIISIGFAELMPKITVASRSGFFLLVAAFFLAVATRRCLMSCCGVAAPSNLPIWVERLEGFRGTFRFGLQERNWK